jgi:membrane protein YdbS with pleckstrin-like domain
MNNQSAANKINDRPILIITAVVLLVSAICLIVNYSVNHSINWSLFPIGALIVIWATVVPMLIMKNNKSLGLFLGLAVTLIPYLFLIQRLTYTTGWVIQLAIPIVVLSLIALGISLIGFRFINNKLYAVALTIFLFGVLANYGVGVIISRFLDGRNMDDVSRDLTMSISGIIALMFLVAGVIKGNKPEENPEYIH